MNYRKTITAFIAIIIVGVSFSGSDVSASTTELVKNGDFEKGNVDWTYNQLATPIINSSSMSGSWYAFTGLGELLDGLDQQPIVLPSDATSISFRADIFLADDPSYSGAASSIMITDYYTDEILYFSLYHNENADFVLTHDITPIKGRTIQVLIITDNSTSNKIGTAEMYMGVDNVSIIATIPDPTPTPTKKPLYRFWSDTHQGHFYTASSSEKDYIIANYADDIWKYEGVAYSSIDKNDSGAKPVYRFWSDTYQHHFYTISASEKDAVIANYADNIWKYEGIAYYAYSSSQANSKPVYRFWSDQKMGHFYTASSSEKDYIIANYADNIWKYESVAWYVPK